MALLRCHIYTFPEMWNHGMENSMKKIQKSPSILTMVRVCSSPKGKYKEAEVGAKKMKPKRWWKEAMIQKSRITALRWSDYCVRSVLT